MRINFSIVLRYIENSNVIKCLIHAVLWKGPGRATISNAAYPKHNREEDEPLQTETIKQQVIDSRE